MNTGLTRVAYLSTNALDLAPDGMVAAINAILAVSQARNQACGVTGALVFNGGFFGQILEGPTAAVEETFERIQNDDRHHDVALLDARPIDQLAFEHWSMGFVGSDEALASAAKARLERTEFDIASLSGDEMFEILSTLALERELLDHA